MPLRNQSKATGFLHTILSNGTKPFRYRSRIGTILGATNTLSKTHRDELHHPSDNYLPHMTDTISGIINRADPESGLQNNIVQENYTNIPRDPQENTGNHIDAANNSGIIDSDIEPSTLPAVRNESTVSKVWGVTEITDDKPRLQKKSRKSLMRHSSKKEDLDSNLLANTDIDHSNPESIISPIVVTKENASVALAVEPPMSDVQIPPAFNHEKRNDNLTKFIQESTGKPSQYHRFDIKNKEKNNSFADTKQIAEIDRTASKSDNKQMIHKVEDVTMPDRVMPEKGDYASLPLESPTSKPKPLDLTSPLTRKVHKPALVLDRARDTNINLAKKLSVNHERTIRELEQAVKELRDKYNKISSEKSDEKSPTKRMIAQPKIIKEVVVVQPSTTPGKSPDAFWERRFLGNVGIRICK